MRLVCWIAAFMIVISAAACNSQSSTYMESPTWKSEPPPIAIWEPDRLVARTEEATISIHHVVMHPGYLTLFYSAELQTVDFDGRIMIQPKATLRANSPDDEQGPTLIKPLYSDADISLGALSFGSFESFDTNSLSFTLVVSELSVERFSDGTRTTIDGPWTIPLIRKIPDMERTSRFDSTHWDGRAKSDLGTVGLSPHTGPRYGESTLFGRVSLRAFHFLDRRLHFMVKPDGDVVEISRERFDELYSE